MVRPLELPELLEHVVSFLDKTALIQCLQVCRRWKSTCAPLLWRSITLDFRSDLLIPTVQARTEYHHLVRHIELYNGYSEPLEDHLSQFYPNLLSLSIRFGGALCATILSLKPLLTSLTLVHVRLKDAYEFWSAVSELEDLQHLSITRIDVGEESIQLFWKVCARVDTLKLIRVRLASRPDPSTVFAHTQLSMFELKDMASKGEDRLGWLTQCPNLTELILPYLETLEELNITSPATVHATWPRLEVLKLPESDISDKDLSLLLGGMKRVKILIVPRTKFGELSFAALRPHLPGLQRLDFGSIRIRGRRKAVTGRMVHEVLSSSPELQSLGGGRVSAVDFLMDGSPWVCGGSLTSLRIYFEFPVADSMDGDALAPLTSTTTIPPALDMQRTLFQRLSTLTALEVLDLSSDSISTSEMEDDGIDFRLSSGLAQLWTLKRLSTVFVNSTMQRMGTEDVEWIAEHFKNLNTFSGMLNADPHINAQLRDILGF
ncbi:hypothetical protein BGZ58_002978 [Dissophora ornata]|nr:hypothetical protein BGZ58_002978 [Dissophora ornata]